MLWLRAALFLVIQIITTFPFAFLGLISFPFNGFTRYRLITGWTHVNLWFVRHLLGIDWQVIGRENIPVRASVVLSKHQSAWETLALQEVFPPQVYVLKRELLRLPVFGWWGLGRLPMIAIDRHAGRDALAQVLEQGVARLAEGWWVVVFPEGTRVAPGGTRRYKGGGAALAVHAGAPVVPVAHNAGEFWGRNSFLKRPGTITVSVGPAIDTAGLSADEVSARAEAWIEAEMRRLFPHHYR